MTLTVALAYDMLRVEEKLIYNALVEHAVKPYLINVTNTPLPCNTAFNAVIVRPVSMFKALHAAAAFWSKNLLTINPWYTIITSGDKILAYTIMEKAQIPIPKTMFALSSRSLLKTVSELGFPLVDKPAYGSWGRLVSLISNLETAKIVAEHREVVKSPLIQHHVVQEYINCGGSDIRCIIVFDEIAGCMYRKAGLGEWRSNIALGGRGEAYKVEPEVEELTYKISELFQGFFLGVDFLHDNERGYLVNEVNGVPEFREFIRATGVDVAKLLVKKLLEFIKR